MKGAFESLLPPPQFLFISKVLLDSNQAIDPLRLKMMDLDLPVINLQHLLVKKPLTYEVSKASYACNVLSLDCF